MEHFMELSEFGGRLFVSSDKPRRPVAHKTRVDGARHSCERSEAEQTVGAAEQTQSLLTRKGGEKWL